MTLVGDDAVGARVIRALDELSMMLLGMAPAHYLGDRPTVARQQIALECSARNRGVDGVWLDGSCGRRQPAEVAWRERKKESAITFGNDTDVYYDPYDIGSNTDPDPTYVRLRENAPIYYNEPYDFWAISRHSDVEQALVN